MVFISETITLDSIINKMTSFNSEDRYNDLGEVLKDINSIGRTTRCLSPEDVQAIVNANKKKRKKNTQINYDSLNNNHVGSDGHGFFSTLKQTGKAFALGCLIGISLFSCVYFSSRVTPHPANSQRPPVVYPNKATDSSSRQAQVYSQPVVAQSRNSAEAVIAHNPFSERIYAPAEEKTNLESAVSAPEAYAADADSLFQNAREYVRTADALSSYDAAQLYKNAAEYLKKAIDINPNNAEYHYYLGKIYAKKVTDNWLVCAIKELKTAVALEPNNAAYHNKLGDVYYYTTQSLSSIRKAIPEYEKAVRLNPKLCLYHINLGKAYYRNYQVTDALGQFELALRLDSSMHSTAKRWFDIAMAAEAQDETNRTGDSNSYSLENHISE